VSGWNGGPGNRSDRAVGSTCAANTVADTDAHAAGCRTAADHRGEHDPFAHLIAAEQKWTVATAQQVSSSVASLPNVQEWLV